MLGRNVYMSRADIDRAGLRRYGPAAASEIASKRGFPVPVGA